MYLIISFDVKKLVKPQTYKDHSICISVIIHLTIYVKLLCATFEIFTILDLIPNTRVFSNYL